MSTVKRMVVINPIEPSPFSLRAPASMETRIETTFRNQDGSLYRQDMAAQLQLTSRSTTNTTTYAMPAIDVANGKARAIIPAGDLTDMNGYRLRLFGTIDQQPQLVAFGVLRLIDAAGQDAVPDDVVDTVNLTFTYNFPADLDVALWDDAAKTNPYDLATTTIAAVIYTAAGGTPIMPFTVAPIGPNAVNLSLTDVQVDTLPSSCWWTLSITTGVGSKLIAQGNITVTS